MFAQGTIPFSEAPNVLAPRLAYEFMSATAQPGLRLKYAQCKILVVAARDDDNIPIKIAREAAAAAPESMYMYCSSTYHILIGSLTEVIYVELPCGHYDVMLGGKV